MSLLSTFTTNSINILAGINGSEVSQALIIAISVIINDLLYMPWPFDFRIPMHLLGNQIEVEIGGAWQAGMAYGSSELVDRHLFSLYFMLPLVGVCLGFMYHNWWARMIQSSNCYFSLAIGILRVRSPETRSAMLLEWPSPWSEYRHTSPRLYSCSLFLRFSTFCSHAHSSSVSCHVLGIAFQGCTIISEIQSVIDQLMISS